MCTCTVPGDNVLSKLVNVLISIKPLYAVMKVLAKNAMKSSAGKKGVQWDSHVAALQNNSEVGNPFSIAYY